MKSTIHSDGALLIPLRVGSESKEIIHGNAVKVSQFDQNVGGNIPLSQLVVAVDLLGAVQIFGQLPLLQVPILPQIPYPLIHTITPDLGYHTAYCCIDKYCKMR